MCRIPFGVSFPQREHHFLLPDDRNDVLWITTQIHCCFAVTIFGEQTIRVSRVELLQFEPLERGDVIAVAQFCANRIDDGSNCRVRIGIPAECLGTDEVGATRIFDRAAVERPREEKTVEQV